MIKLGVILAGGRGTRLYPLTEVINKHLLPIYNKPMIYYPISTLLMLKCDRIILLTNSEDKIPISKISTKLEKLNIKTSIKFQGQNQGIPSAIYDAVKDEEFDELYTILGDNIFFGNGFIKDVKDEKANNLILTKKVKRPSLYGVLTDQNNIKKIVEKPKSFVGNTAVTGFYKFNKDIMSFLVQAKPSLRGETEIADILNNILTKQPKTITEVRLNRATLWLDAGNFEDLSNSNTLISQIVQRQGQDFGCIEENALDNNYINKNDLRKIIKDYPKNEYKDYIEHLLK